MATKIKTKEKFTAFSSDVTVEDLINALKKCNPKAIVVGNAKNFELKSSTIPVSSVTEREYFKVKRTFRDAFDNETYEKEVFSISQSKPTDKIVKCVEISM